MTPARATCSGARVPETAGTGSAESGFSCGALSSTVSQLRDGCRSRTVQEFFEVGVPVPVSIQHTVSGVIWIERILHLPGIGHAVIIAIGTRRAEAMVSHPPTSDGSSMILPVPLLNSSTIRASIESRRLNHAPLQVRPLLAPTSARTWSRAVKASAVDTDGKSCRVPFHTGGRRDRAPDFAPPNRWDGCCRCSLGHTRWGPVGRALHLERVRVGAVRTSLDVVADVVELSAACRDGVRLVVELAGFGPGVIDDVVDDIQGATVVGARRDRYGGPACSCGS